MASLRSNAGGFTLHFIALLSTMLVFDQIPLAFSTDPDPLQDFCVADFGANNVVRVNGYPCKDRALLTSEDFAFSGLNKKGNTKLTGTDAIITYALVQEYPALNTLGISHVRLDIEPGGVIPPHTHPLATESIFVVEGSVYTGFISYDNKLFAKTLQKGDLYLFPRATLHFQLNVGKKPAITFNSFNAQFPGLLIAANQLLETNISKAILMKSFGADEASITSLTASMPRYWG